MVPSESETGSVRGGMTDLHNHLMPGVDDGAVDEEESRTGLLALKAAGVGRLATTPHVDASALLRPSWERRVEELDAAWERLLAVARDAVPGLMLHRAAEVRLDVPDPDLSDKRLRLGGGPAVLVEFAYFTVPPYSDRMIARIHQRGWIPVVAHPERYRTLGEDLTVVAAWRAAGAVIQVNAGSLTGRYGTGAKANAGSLTGRYGTGAKANATALLTSGHIDCLASDYHSRGTPELEPARAWLDSIGASDHAELLLDVNPARVLAGEPPLPVPPLERRPGFMSKLWNAVRRA